MSDPRGWRKQEEAIEAAKEEILAKLAEGGGAVKSIQRGVVVIEAKNKSGTATINSVNIDKAVVLYGGFTGNSSSNAYIGNAFAYLTLTNATTVTAARAFDGSNSNYTLTFPYQVIEFE